MPRGVSRAGVDCSLRGDGPAEVVLRPGPAWAPAQPHLPRRCEYVTEAERGFVNNWNKLQPILP